MSEINKEHAPATPEVEEWTVERDQSSDSAWLCYKGRRVCTGDQYNEGFMGLPQIINSTCATLRAEIEELKQVVESQRTTHVVQENAILRAAIERLRKALEEIATSCDDLSKSEGIDAGETRAWRAIRNVASAALKQKLGETK